MSDLKRTIEAWSKVSSRTVAYECSREHIHHLIADALHDISRLAKSAWKPITAEIDRKVLVTNNLESRDAFGQMSHVWIANIVLADDNRPGEFCAFDHYLKVESLTHYAEIPT